MIRTRIFPFLVVNRVLRLAWCFSTAALVGHADGAGASAKRIYIEPFATGGDAEQLRKEVTAELRKLNSLSLVEDKKSADLTLGAGGEIWVKAYRSFNPRAELKIPSTGVPIYSGYLSVELRDTAGVTLWSDLVTPPSTSGNVEKDLAKHLARDISDAFKRPLELPEKSAVQPPVTLTAAGATFPYPVYSKWFTNYKFANPGFHITYDAIGSEAGVRKLLSHNVDFAASDSPNVVRDLLPAGENNYLFLPSVVGAVVPIVNLPGVAHDLAFTPEALADIFLGKITKWDDPMLRASNPGVRLPSLDIVVVHRSDGSGTSWAWTDYLSKKSPEWRETVGSSLSPKWPVGRGAAGNEGVAQLVTQVQGAIGYVEFIYALEHHLSYGKVRNRNGEFIAASLQSIAAALAGMPKIPEDLKVSIIDAPGPGAYPIASFTWFVVPAHIQDDADRHAISSFLEWMLGPGQRQAAALGYLALPSEMVVKELDAISRIR